MNTELELTSRLDALGRSLGASAPLEPPAVFLEGVHRQHRVTLVKKSALGAAACVVLVALVMVAARSGRTPPEPGQRPAEPRKFELPALGAMRSLINSPDDIEDAPLLPPTNEGPELPAKAKEWRRELLE